MAYHIVLVSAIHQDESAEGGPLPREPPSPLPLGTHRALAEPPESHSKFPLAVCSAFGNGMCQGYSLSSSHSLLPLSYIFKSTSMVQRKAQDVELGENRALLLKL